MTLYSTGIAVATARMSTSRAAIRKLSPETRGRLRSDVAATNFAQCIEELITNAIDASATCVDVEVSYLVPSFVCISFFWLLLLLLLFLIFNVTC